MARRLALASTLLAVLSLAACGSEKSDKDQVKDTAQQLLDSDKDVCGKLTDRFSKATFGGSKDKCEKSAEKGGDSPDAKITSLAVKGDAATVTVKTRDGNNQVKLVKDGDWKIDRLVAASGQSEEDKARAAVEAFIGAIKGDDAQAFCGLLSEKFARKVTGKKEFGVAECVKQVEKSGLGSLKAKVGSASVRSVVVGRGATVTLSTGDVIAVRKQGARYVIDAINGKA
jgi:hypothetical protein